MGDILHENAQVSGRLFADQFLVHVGFPSQPLHVRVCTHRDEALAPPVVAVPEMLQQPQNPEDLAMRFHEAFARIRQTARIAGAQAFRDSIGRPTGVSIYDLPETIRSLRQAGFATTKHEVWYQVELARPLFLMAMVLVGAAFTMRHARFGGTGIAVLTAVMLGFGLYFVRNFAQILGENGQIPVALAAWGPPIASIFLTLGLLLHAEDG